MTSPVRATARALVPKPVREALRRTWQRLQRSRRRAKARRGTLVRRYEIRLPPGGTRQRLRIEAPWRSSIAARLERGFVGFEPEGLGCVLALLERLGAGTFFDVGANIAPYSLVASALTDWTVVAFEPVPDVAKLARQLRDLNGFAYTVERCALGEQPGRLPLYISTSSDTSSSLDPDWRPSKGTVKVTVDTLDAYCERTSAWPAVLKIDTETTEPAVLRGGSRLLAERRPWIVCEVLQGHTEDALEAIIGTLGYRRYHIRGGGELVEAERLEGRAAEFLDWLLAPEPVDARLAKRALAWTSALLDCAPGS